MHGLVSTENCRALRDGATGSHYGGEAMKQRRIACSP